MELGAKQDKDVAGGGGGGKGGRGPFLFLAFNKYIHLKKCESTPGAILIRNYYYNYFYYLC